MAWMELLLCVVCLYLGTVFAAPHAEMHGDAPGLTYDKHGADWPGLCQTGKSQSPIDIISPDFVSIGDSAGMVKIDSLGVVSGVELFVTESLPHVEFEWEKFVSPPKASVPATKDGDIFAAASGEVNTNDLKQVAIEAVQCHFHTPSEHTLDGRLHDGVLHCVHFVKDGESAKCDREKAKSGLGCPVVLSIFLNAGGGPSSLDRFFGESNIIHKLDDNTDHGLHSLGKANAKKIEGEFDLNTFLPESGEYATWPGSLTTLPCTEGVLWVKMLQPISVSPEQIGHLHTSLTFAAGPDCQIFQGSNHCVPSRMPFNNRVRQSLHGRVLRKGSAY